MNIFKILNKEEENANMEMQEIGRRISLYRKAINMTQNDLAEEMGISYQAVSSWERGQTLPDVLKLSDLAKVLKVSVEDILTGKLANEEEQVNLEKIDIKIDEKIKEENKEEIVDIIDSGNKQKFDSKSIVNIASYTSSDTLTKLTVNYIKEGNGSNIGFIKELLPYFEEEDIAEVIIHLVDVTEANDDKVNEVMDLIISSFDYMDEDDTFKICKMMIEKGFTLKEELICNLVNFLDSYEIVSLFRNYDLETKTIELLCPYLDEDDIDELIFKDKDKR